MTWLDMPLLAWDTETTGVDLTSDRVVTVAIGRSSGPGDWSLIEDSLVNPGVPIPEDATRVHGITNEMATEGAAPGEVLASVLEVLEQAVDRQIPVVGFNVPFDATIIDRELRRHLGRRLPLGLIFVDVLVLFRRFDFTTGGRSLEQLAYRNGIKFPAHNAAADARAALDLLRILADSNDLLPWVQPADLHELQAGWYEAQQLAAHHKRRGNGRREAPPNTDWPTVEVAW